MGFLRRSQGMRFYRNDRTKQFGNPMRRWLYHYVLAGSVLAGTAYVTFSYYLAGLEAKWYSNSRGERLCSSGMIDFLMLLPFNRISNAFGRLADGGTLSTSTHQKLINFLVWFYGIDLQESTVEEFDTLQKFYVRSWKPEARPVAHNLLAACPCDGVVIATEDNATEMFMVQVKGLSYDLRSLFRFRPEPVPAGMKRVVVVFHMRVKDFHHVISPVDWRCVESIYVPGGLLPTSANGWHWIPSVLSLNERLVIHGATCDASNGVMALALVGSTLSGRLKLHLDERITTNFCDPPSYAVHMPYQSKPFLKRGKEVGTFYWGSAVVLMMDVPQQAKLLRSTGDVVKAGEGLIQN